MSLLVVSDDELGLLRFTCDLYFVEESPLFYLEKNPREPADFDHAYKYMVKKAVVDPHDFRITDEALNRIAPVTECDGRVVHLHCDCAGHLEETNYYVLDEIAVQYVRGDMGHGFGLDLDREELVEHLARRFVPRRSAGDMVDVHFTSLEFLAFAQLARPSKGADTVRIHLHDAAVRLGPAPDRELVARSSPGVLSVLNARASGGRAPRGNTNGPIGDATWDEAVEGLLGNRVFRLEGDELVLRPGLHDVVTALAGRERHTFVRYDFGESEWFTRETTLLPTEGGLFFLGQRDDGLLRLRELDGESMREALESAVAPLLPKDDEESAIDEVPSYLSQYQRGIEEEADTEIMTRPPPRSTSQAEG